MAIPVTGVVADVRGYKLKHVLQVDGAVVASDLDINSLTVKADPDESADYLPIFSVADGANRKILVGSIDHDLLTNWLADKHIDHAAVTISAGAGLTGGGDITLSRTLAVDGSTVGPLIDHGSLADLLADDHPQYPLAAGIETISGAWTFTDVALFTSNVGVGGNIIVVGTTDTAFLITTFSATIGTTLDVGTDAAINGFLTCTDAEATGSWIISGAGNVNKLRVTNALATANYLNVDTSGLLITMDISVVSRQHAPVTDNLYSLGTAALRWTNLFLSGSILDSTSAQIYVRRSGADTMTGFWNIGSNKLGINTAASTGNLNVAVSGTATPGIFFSIGGSTSEEIINSISGGFGWVWSLDNSADGDFRLKVNAAKTQRYRFYRDSNRFHIGSTASITPLASEALTVEGLVHATAGATFNSGGGATDPTNFFKVFKSDGTEGALHINPNTSTAGGVGFFTTAVSGGILNYGSGLVSSSKAGLNVTCQFAVDNLLEWSSSSVFAGGAFGHGVIQDELNTGDKFFFVKNGTAANTNAIYIERANARVGIGPAWVFGAPPLFALDVNGKIHTDNEIEIDGALNHDGTTVGFYGVAPATQPSAYTQTYATSTKTHANLTSATLTDSTGGTANTTVVAIAGTGDDANLNNNFADLIAQINALRVDLENAKQVLNAVIDDDQSIGIKQ